MSANYASMSTTAERLAAARTYYGTLTEQAADPDMSDGSRSVNYGSLQTALSRVQRDIERYEQQLASEQRRSNGGRVLYRFGP